MQGPKLAAFATRVVLAIGAGALTGLGAAALAEPSHTNADTALMRLPDAPTVAESAAANPSRRSRKDDAPQGQARLRRYGVTFFHAHTREILPVPMAYTPPAEGAAEDDEGTWSDDVAAIPTEELDSFLRCRVTHDHRGMSRTPVEVAVSMARHFQRRRINVVSGYRSPKFNMSLRKKGHEVARASYHMSGEALDFRLAGVSARELADAVEGVHRGGIGRYDRSGFVHVDIGPTRDWRGR